MTGKRSRPEEIVIVAIGGNAIASGQQPTDVYMQFANTRRCLAAVVDLIESGRSVVVTHGNGPQIGDKLIRVEASRHLVPPIPLGVLVADTQGSMGYMIAQILKNELTARRIDKDVTTVLTQVLVARDDSSMAPTKFVGPAYSKKDALALSRDHGWIMKEDVERGWRRVVPSPQPLDILEKNAIRNLLHSGSVVVCVGGGGIPVYRQENGSLEGVDAVVDKDRASAVLGREIGASALHILTAVDAVYLDYGRENERALRTLSLRDAQRYLREGQFPPGSMGPKIESAISFLEAGGKSVLITEAYLLREALEGNAGTWIRAVGSTR
jgi:carbamate kinase